MPRYSPFTVPLTQLFAAHLSQLTEVSEGWNVEYKSRLVEPKAIAKSISAFANQHGGWLFYGIEQTRNGTNCPGKFLGIPSAEVDAALKRITNAVADNISPNPFYASRVVQGPCTEVGLEADRAVIAIEVPPGNDPPYIHRSGQIFRRVGESSDPKPETDRLVLDQLWEKSRRGRNGLHEALSKRSLLSEEDSKIPFLQLTLFSNPLERDIYESKLTFEDFATVMREMDAPRPVNVPFDNIFTSSSGFVARLLDAAKPKSRGMTWEYARGGTSIVSLPLPEGLLNADSTRRFSASFGDAAERSGISRTQVRIMDLTLLLSRMGNAIFKHGRLVKMDGIETMQYAKMRFLNVWRRIPYLDTPHFAQFVATYGLPVIQDDDVFAPPGTSIESLIAIANDPYPIPYQRRHGGHELRGVIPLLIAALLALGIPLEVTMNSFMELIEAGERLWPKTTPSATS